ncbi:spore germination protein [Clostridium ganghwense]|uniref:Spore germination protein n=1 Tax=Clostridium ganghwense TaxID=312089 RepID=A0ABT4CRP7_9CLOT|nr:spore germination protein [Clostridium ganghwense]MCY6371707.1 spore germination protein [Clostridium ganghwense]
MCKNDIEKTAQDLKNLLGNQENIIIKKINVGKDIPIKAFIIYINAIADKNIIDTDILKPLMLHTNENLNDKEDINNYLCETYISLSNIYIEQDINKVIAALKRGKTAVFTEISIGYILADTIGGKYRNIIEPEDEASTRDSKEGFVENLETNISMIRRRLKDDRLIIETLTLGRRTQTDISLLYIGDIANDNVINELRKRLNSIDVDNIIASGMLEQYIEHEPYCIFPQYVSSQRPDRIVSEILEGKAAIVIDGSPSVLLAPSTFFDFFQSVDDYYNRTIIATFIRILRMLAVFIVITLPSIYLTLLKFNAELIPIKFITPIIQSRTGIALTPFLEILSMEIMVEFLREGGLRLPSKIAQTLSVVGGIIIGDTAIQSKIVSPSTLLIVGITVISSFLIPNYDMSISIRFIRFPMLILSNFLGIFGISIGWFFILIKLFYMQNYGVEYLAFFKDDMKDTLVRVPLWKMNKRPVITSPKDNIRQTDFRKKWNGGNNKNE